MCIGKRGRDGRDGGRYGSFGQVLYVERVSKYGVTTWVRGGKGDEVF
jgi:hypothetical protein